MAVLLTSMLPATADASGLWDDRPLRIIQTTDPQFPSRLLQEGVREGAVRAVLHVDADGQLLDCLITGVTHPAFASELLGHVRSWRFEPSHQRGEPIGARVEATFTFEARGQVVSVSSSDAVSLRTREWTKAELQSHLGKVSELDAPPTLRQVVPPHHPGLHLKPPEPRGSATVDFYIDVEGRPRMPVVTRASHEAFGAAAIEAITQWRFAPPKRAGQPVVVRATQVFTFSDADPERVAASARR